MHICILNSRCVDCAHKRRDGEDPLVTKNRWFTWSKKFKSFTFYIRDDPVDALPNPGNNGISMDFYHIIWLLFEFFHQQRGGFFWDVVFHEVRCLPLEAAVCWDDFEGAKKPFSRCRCFLFSSLWKFTLLGTNMTYPIKMHFWRWFSFSQGGTC